MSLFDDFYIGKTYFKNRSLVVLPVKDNAQKSGKISNTIKDEIDDLVKKGIGTIILDSVYVSKRGRQHNLQLGIGENHILELKKLIAYTDSQEVVLGIRLSHAGSKTNKAICGDIPISAYKVNKTTLVKNCDSCKAFDNDEIEEIIMDFKHSAEQAEEAGFKIIEINGGDQDLLEQCFNPKFNQREDKYGGNSLKNRMNLAVEIIEAIKTRLNKSFLSYYFPIYEKQENIYTPKKIQEIVKLLESAGIDILNPATLHVLNSMFKPAKSALEWVGEFSKKNLIATGNIKSINVLSNAIKFKLASFYTIESPIYSRPNWYYFIQKKLER